MKKLLLSNQEITEFVQKIMKIKGIKNIKWSGSLSRKGKGRIFVQYWAPFSCQGEEGELCPYYESDLHDDDDDGLICEGSCEEEEHTYYESSDFFWPSQFKFWFPFY